VQPGALEILAAHGYGARMTLTHVRDVRLVVRHANDAANDVRRASQSDAKFRKRHCRSEPVDVRAAPGLAMVRSNRR